jgi:preprotein translocase subunit SecG
MNSIAAVLPYIDILLAVLLIACILMQQGDPDLGGAFGGSDNFSSSYHTRRGFEKVLFNSTIILGILFIVATFLNLVI